jgi:beta-galactosidase
MKLFLAPLLLAIALVGCTETRNPVGVPPQGSASATASPDAPAVANFATPPTGQGELAPLGVNVGVFDPAGETAAMLTHIGCRVTTLEQRGSAPALLAVGRRALSDGKPLPVDLEAYVRDGGRLILFAQDPDWTRKLLRLRVAEYLARRVFPVSATHPACAGLDAEDLRDWTGESRLVEPKPEVADVTRGSPYGWRWGGRGAVASFAVEKPHHAGWRPILECEFDLAYSPLMELDYGKGMVFLCGLDLEDHVEADPAARQIARQFLAYAATRPPMPRLATVLAGNDDDRKLLDSMGVAYRAEAAVPAAADTLLILGRADVDDAALRRFLAAGGKVLVLARRDAAAAPLGLTLAAKADCLGSTAVPDWPECAGLSASDLRARASYENRVFTGGGEIGADGMLARVVIGKGVAILSQFDPRTLHADEKTYLRYTRWRQTRVLAQLLANLGAAFQQDATIFKSDNRLMALPLAGEWRARQIVVLPSSPAENKPKNVFSKEAKAAILAETDDDWQTVKVPGDWERFGGTWADADGEAVFRKTVTIPAEWQGLDLELSLGPVDDFDDTFWNGQMIGGIDQSDPAAWSKKRRYLIPARMVKIGPNRLAVRIFDHFGGGGFTGRPEELSVEPKRPGEIGWYHADYLNDFGRGDDPYRYYRW